MNKLLINLASRAVTLLPLTEEEAAQLNAPAATPVPASVSMRQLRLWLIDHDMLEEVEEALNTIPDPQQRAIALTNWEYATTITRTHPQTLAIGDLMQLTPEELDDLFIEAAGYE